MRACKTPVPPRRRAAPSIGGLRRGHTAARDPPPPPRDVLLTKDSPGSDVHAGAQWCGACACAPFRRRVVTRPPNSNLVSTAAAASHHTHTSISPAGRPRPRPQSKATRVIISTSAVAFLRMCVHHINIVTYSIIVRAFVFPTRVRPSIVVLFRP